MFQVGTEKITVYQINLLKVQKNWFVILFQVDSTYTSNSISQIGNSFAFHLTSLISLADYQLLDFLFFFFRKKWDQLFRNFTFKARSGLKFFGKFAVEYRVKFGVTCASYFTYLYQLKCDAFVFTRWMILNYYDVFGERANLRLAWLWGDPPILNCADKISNQNVFGRVHLSLLNVKWCLDWELQILLQDWPLRSAHIGKNDIQFPANFYVSYSLR